MKADKLKSRLWNSIEPLCPMFAKNNIANIGAKIPRTGKKNNQEEVKNMSNASKIRSLRENLGLRRTEFGLKIGCTYGQVERLEDGLTPLTEELRTKICREYGVNEDWFDGSSGAPQLEENRDLRRKRLKRILEESGLSQREFGKSTHTSASLLNEILSGKKQLTIKYAKKIEETLGVGADWLLYGDEDAKEYPLSDAVIKYMKKHPEIRKEIYGRMETDEAVMSKDAAGGT
ncbi:MAG: helix-turn-helix domain-containing protein [Lachnospiraceae bacterium]|nr:helix-turn-helix domain-containing protein [Lachnospiraceae bacterium]